MVAEDGRVVGIQAGLEGLGVRIEGVRFTNCVSGMIVEEDHRSLATYFSDTKVGAQHVNPGLISLRYWASRVQGLPRVGVGFLFECCRPATLNPQASNPKALNPSPTPQENDRNLGLGFRLQSRRCLPGAKASLFHRPELVLRKERS